MSKNKEIYLVTLNFNASAVKWDNEIFSLSPFLHFLKDGVGRETYLSFFKGKKEGKYWFEPITKRDEISFDPLQARFDGEQAVLINLIVP